MPFIHTLTEVVRFAATALALPVAAAALTTKYLAARTVGADVARTDRLVGYLSEDLRRWMADRDRQAGVRMSEIAQQAASMGVRRGGALPQAQGKVYRQVLHDYRDEATRKLRALDDQVASEGRLHRLRRRRSKAPAPALALDAESLAILARWRSVAAEDPSGPDAEPRLATLERWAA